MNLTKKPIVTVDDDDRWVGATIDTDQWIEALLGEPDEQLQASFDSYVESSDNRWDLEDIEDYCEAHGLVHYGSNTANYESDLDSCLDWGYAAPKDSSDSFYSATILFLRRHQGGDIRCNYGSVEVFRLDDIDSSLFHFINPVVEWGAIDGSLPDGTEIPREDLWKYDEEFRAGYSANPSHHLQESIEYFKRIDETTVEVMLKSGVKLTLSPGASGVY